MRLCSIAPRSLINWTALAFLALSSAASAKTTPVAQSGKATTIAKAAAKPKATGAEILNVTPRDLSETTNQIRVGFSDVMVDLGSPADAGKIFSVNCVPQMGGTGRWNDNKTWVFDFETKLAANKVPGGTRCELKLQPGVKTLAGKSLTGSTSFQFQIDGPNIIETRPYSWDPNTSTTVNEDQVFILVLDAEVDPSSVLIGAHFSVDGKASPVPVRIVEGDERKAILSAEFGSSVPEQPVLLIQPKEKFPAKTKLQLVWGPGIVAKDSSIARKLTYKQNFSTRDQLEAQFSCTRENAKAGCSPILNMTVSFTAPVAWADVQSAGLVAPDGTVRHPLAPTDGETHVTTLTFKGPFPENTTYTLNLPANLKDDAGRPLANQANFPLKNVKVEKFPPLAKFSANFGVIESKVQPVVLPATLRNLEAQVLGQMQSQGKVQGQSVRYGADNFAGVVKWLKVFERRSEDWKNREKSIFPPRPKAQAKGVEQFTIPMENNGQEFRVVGIPLHGEGFHVVELESLILGKSLLGKNSNVYVQSSALVTNLAVHSKWGRESSLFFVTALDTGRPVGGATVKVANCMGAEKWSGQTDANGILIYKGQLKQLVDDKACESEKSYTKYNNGFFVTAQVANDFTFTHSSWTEGIEAWRFANIESTSPAWGSSTVAMTSVLDRTLLRAGETVSMKHLARGKTLNGFGAVNYEDLPKEIRIVHSDSGTTFKFPLKWDSTNLVAETQWSIPKEAKLGYYSVELSGGKNGADGATTAYFRVEEFKVPLMKGQITLPTSKQVQPGNLNAQLSVNFQNGGPVAGLDAIFRYFLDDKGALNFENYEDFVFANGKVEENTNRKTEDETSTRRDVISKNLKLDANGAASATAQGLLGYTGAKTLTTELEFRDANGETQTVSNSQIIYPSTALVGIKAMNWVSTGKKVDFEVAVADLDGKPVVSAPVTLTAYSQKTYSHRQRLVGGFYSYESVTETKKLNVGFNCASRSTRGTANCSVEPGVSGNVILVAEATDAQGRKSYANASVYVHGESEWWFGDDNSDRIDLIPEHKRYEPGQVAKFQLRMPFREATALVAVEREGIISAKVVQVSGQNPTIETDIKDNYAPNVYVSALVVRGRVGNPSQDEKETALVDLAKPSFKLGIAQVLVDWRAHQLEVGVATDKDVYKPRDTAYATITLRDVSGAPLANAEAAVAVVDEGLLELSSNKTWDLLSEMMGSRPYEIETSTGQLQVVGKRHYGLKAVPTGGDGGHGAPPTREIFDTLLYWNARVKTDSNGRAQVSFKLNDSLTKFRIVAVAQSGLDKFGKGEKSITANQDLILLPALTKTARQGDAFTAEYTVRNTQNVAATVILTGVIRFYDKFGKQICKTDSAGVKVCEQPLDSQSLAMAAGESKHLNLAQVSVPANAARAEYLLTVSDGAGKTDQVKSEQQITPALAARTLMAQMDQVDKQLPPVPVALPAGAFADQGGIKVSLLGSLASGLETVKDYFADYPFVSLEYRVSRAVATENLKLWQDAMSRLPAFLDENGLVKFYVNSTEGSDALTAYILSIANQSGLAVPAEPQAQMLEGLKKFVNGQLSRGNSREQTELGILAHRLNAISALVRYNQVDLSMLASLPNLDVSQLPNAAVVSALHVYSSIGGAATADRLAAAEASLQARLTLQGTTFKLTQDKVQLWDLFKSQDAICSELIAVLLGNTELKNRWSSVLPKMARGNVGRMQRGSWDTTLANAWGVQSLRAFSLAFEKTPVAGETLASLASVTQSFKWSTSSTGGVLQFNWPVTGTGDVHVNHSGDGKPWAIVSVAAAVPLKAPLQAGFNVSKEVKPIRQAKASGWTLGDIAEVTLKIKSSAENSNIAILDPIPANAKILGSGLGGSKTETGPTTDGYAWPQYEEFATEGYRAFYDYIGETEVTVVYRVQFNAAGSFHVPNTRVEAVYTPEVFAEIPNESVSVSSP